MTKSAELIGKTYMSGLTQSELDILAAVNTVSLSAISLQDFKISMVKPLTISGIKQLPSQEEFIILYDLIVSKYHTWTIGDLQLAFDLNALGTEWTRIDHFNMFSVQYVSDVLTKYIEYNRKMYIEIKKKEVRKELPMSERVVEENPAIFDSATFARPKSRHVGHLLVDSAKSIHHCNHYRCWNKVEHAVNKKCCNLFTACASHMPQFHTSEGHQTNHKP